MALLAQRFKQGLDGTPIAFAAVLIGLEPGRQRFGEPIEFAHRHPLRLLGLDHLALAQPGFDGVSCQAGTPLDLFDWKAIAQVHPANLCQCSHVDHSLIHPVQKTSGRPYSRGQNYSEFNNRTYT
ncbi:MAG: hypothetical protein KGZ70_02135 [Hydrogenophaga sp.]|uniref:hypothetical protein n=1 Tax=Hydrogenophaga sp. TaxID=1904254 RepID=UPI001BBE04C0|nr:hypothetical protein [Hydrogenophaga sp.]MBS3910629.1 hypothetical protein [Hydrogenophaga sp.]MDP2164987.1 hypothetical protein [Hydrogenophaga sp.]MDP3477969.1 hypothetical protein [Hydrogenophaga sp.]